MKYYYRKGLRLSPGFLQSIVEGSNPHNFVLDTDAGACTNRTEYTALRYRLSKHNLVTIYVADIETLELNTHGFVEHNWVLGYDDEAKVEA